MKKHIIAAAAISAILAGCTTTTQEAANKSEATPPVQTASSTATPSDQVSSTRQVSLPAGYGEIVVFRTNSYGFLISPAVLLDGAEAGKCAVGKMFSLKAKAGNHVLSATTLGTTKINVPVQAGKTTYVECSIGIGVIAGTAKLRVTSDPKKIAKANKL